MLSWFKSTGLRRPYAIIHLTTHHSWFNCKNMSLVQHLPKSAMTHPGRSSKGLRHGAHAWKWWEGGQSQSAYWITTLHYIISSSYIMSCVMKRSRMVYRQLYIWQIIYIYVIILYVSLCICICHYLSTYSNDQQSFYPCLSSIRGARRPRATAWFHCHWFQRKPWENPWRSWKYMKIIEDP